MTKIITLADNFANEKFLLGRAMAYIAENIEQKTVPVDFSEYIFVLPSAEAGRLFREKAAIIFQPFGGAAGLTTILPEQLLFQASDINHSEVSVISDWFNILKNVKPSDFRSKIFPELEYNTETLISLAENFSKIRENILIESGLDSGDFLQTLPEDSTLKTKLSDYLELEKLYLKKLGGAADKATAIKNSLNDPFIRFKGIKKIILIENSELRNSIKIMLDKLSEKIEVIHLVNTTANELENFDNHGCPITGKMLQTDLPIDLEKNLRTFSNPIREAEKIASFLTKDSLPASIGIMDNELALTLTHLLEEKNIEVFLPEVKSLKSFYWSKLFLTIADLRKKHISFEEVYKLASDDTFVNMFKINGVKLRSQIEKLQREHLIQDFEFLEFFAAKHRKNTAGREDYSDTADFCVALRSFTEKIRKIPYDSMPEGLWDIFAETAAFTPLDNMDMNEAEISLDALKNLIVSVKNISDKDIKMIIFRHRLANTSIAGTEMYKDQALKFSGFLDLIWYENPSLILGGISEEAFSNSAVEDNFFPEHVRNSLNWSSAYSRFGADIHRFEQLLKQYSDEEFFITFASASKSGELHTVPRLFFNVNDEKLLNNCKLVFGSELAEKMPAPNEKKEMKYSSHITDHMPESISVTAFKEYIECPYSFYLQKILNCKDNGQELLEIQANMTGTIIHSVLENYGKTFRNSLPDDIEDLKKYCLKELELQFYNSISSAPNALVLMQNEEIRKNITAFAEYEFNVRNSISDFKIVQTEKKINISLQSLIDRLPQKYIDAMPVPAPECADIKIVGTIDRIDYFHDADGNKIYRIIDYKSSNEAQTPAQAHFTSVVPEHLEPEMLHAGTNSSDKDIYFCNMQLIIYSLFANFMRDELDIENDALIQCGYYNIPLDVKNTSIEIFSELDDNMLKKGAASLVYLMNRIFAERRFWPPALTAKYGVAKKYLETNNADDFEIKEQS